MVKGFVSRDNLITVVLGVVLTITFCMAMYLPIASFRQDNAEDYVPGARMYTYTGDSTISTY